MKKFLKIVAVIILALVLLTPMKLAYTDGGTVVYGAILYSVTNYHRIHSDPTVIDAATGRAVIFVKTGIEVKVLGLTLYDNTRLTQR